MSIEFVKTHSRDNLILYEWKDEDFGLDVTNADQVDKKKVERILLNYLRTCRIKNVVGSLEDSPGLETKITSLVDSGSILILGNSFQSIQEIENQEHFVVIMKIAEKSFHPLPTSTDGMALWFQKNLNCLVTVRAVFSTHKPRVDYDYWVIHLSKLDERRIMRHRPQLEIEDDNKESESIKNDEVLTGINQIIEYQEEYKKVQFNMRIIRTGMGEFTFQF